MYLSHTTGSEDTLIEQARSAPTLSDLIEIIERFDEIITEKNDSIEELSKEIDDLKGQISNLEESTGS